MQMSKVKSIQESFKNDTWIRSFLKDNRGLFILVIFLGFMTAFSASALMFVSGYLITKASTKPYNILLIYTPIVLTRGFGISRPAFRYVQRLTSHNWVLKMTSKLRLRLYETIESTGIFFREKFKSGDILAILTEDVGHIQNLYIRSVIPSLVALMVYVFIIVATGIINLYFGIGLFIAFGVLLFIGPILSLAINGSRVSNKKIYRTRLYKKITDSILGLGDYYVSGQKEKFHNNIKRDEEKLAELERDIRTFSRKRDLLLQVFFVSSAIIVVVFAGLYFENFTNKNWIAAFILCVFPLSDTFLPISNGIEEIASHERSVNNVNDLSKKVENKNYTKLEHDIDYYVKNTDTAISMSGLNFRYADDENRQILDTISLDIKKDEKICILGKSGAGKSTLLKLLTGDLKTQSGQIKIFGQDMTNVDVGKERVLGVLNQSPWIFNTTIFNNLKLGNDKLTYDKASEIIKIVGLKDKIDSLENGLNTVVDEGGGNFSGGEKQRIALARILVMDTPIILLDEPTVGLDPVTEHEILDTIFKVFADKTIVWVTHHLQDIEKMDRVIYLKEGKIIMDDTPNNLLEKNEFFRMLYSIDKGF